MQVPNTELATILWILTISILFGLSIVFISKSIKNEGVQRKVFIGYATFMIAYGCTRLFFLIGTLNIQDQNTLNFFHQAGYITGYVSAILIFFVLEKYSLLNTKFIFTTVSIVSLIVAILLPYHFRQYFSYVTLPILIISIILMYISIGIKTSGEVRTYAVGTGFSVFIILSAMILDTDFVRELGMIQEVAPILMIIACILFVYFQRTAGE
ncbi:MAG: hypothetical protein ACTSX4_01940 [Candidatus Helarchaeota archaeon]